MLDLNRFLEGNDLFDGRYDLVRPLHKEESKTDIWLAIDTQTIDSEDGIDPGSQRDKDGMYVAIKIYRPKDALDIEGEQHFRDEYKIVFDCRHANLLQPTSFSIFEGCPYLVLPYCRHGSCEQLVGKKLVPEEVWKFILDVSSGLNRLHTNIPRIIHQDIKPSNILIDNLRNYAITDFGISSQKRGVHGYGRGSKAFIAPERFREKAFPIPESDIWGFGATLFAILTGKAPFGEEGGMEQMKNGGRIPDMPGVPAVFQRLVRACLDKDPTKRPSALQLMEAARLKRFPVKRSPRIWVLAGVLAALAIAAGVLSWTRSRRDHPMETPDNVVVHQPSMQESYDKAMALLGSKDRELFMEGYRQMDGLCNLGYIPAMYQMAFTHGWYTDEESLRRKDLLGIKYDKSEKIPLSDIDNQKAITWLQMIMERGDSSYASVNAQASYRLAGYYRKGKVLQRDDKAVVDWMNKARDWAFLSGDAELLEKTEAWLKNIK